jgi:oxygen-independent coproporphyrinogen-3 oxidase
MSALYIHIPFCSRKCGYCDFYSTENLDLIPRFLKALSTEMTQCSERFRNMSFDTVYAGGGTPSLLAPEQITRLAGQISEFFRVPADSEKTLEINPGTLSSSKLDAWLESGFNRLSVGAQSFSNAELNLLGRIHRSEDTRKAFKMARRAGFKNIGLDLIYALPGQTLAILEKNLQQALSLCPEHISAYSLTWSSRTPLGRAIQQGKLPAPDENLTADMFLSIHEILSAQNYDHYEVSNYSLPGFECLHNSHYWDGTPYLGLGPSAHSYDGNARWWNSSDTADYLARLEAGKSPCKNLETLSEADHRLERIALGLRTKNGIGLDDLHNMEDEVNLLTEKSLAHVKDGRLVLTPGGMLLTDEIAARLA